MPLIEKIACRFMQNNVKPFDIRARVMYNVGNIYFMNVGKYISREAVYKTNPKDFPHPFTIKIKEIH